MTRKLALVGTLAAAIWTAGCLQKETTHTLYLSPDGRVAWVAIERNVRSDAEQSAARSSEEAEYLAAALSGTGDIARGLAALDAKTVRTRVLRRERPFAVMTEARFDDVELLARQILGTFRVNGDAYVSRADGVTTLHIHIDARGGEDGEENNSPVMGLVEELASYKIVLTEGTFTAADGFAVSRDGTIASPIVRADEEMAANPVFELSLSWRP